MLVVKPVTVNNFAALLNCTPAGRGSDLMKASAEKLSIKLVWTRLSIFGRFHRGSTVAILLLQCFSKGLAVKYSSCFISMLDLDLYVCWFDA